MSDTRKFGQVTHCPKCGYEHTAESAFSRWVRNFPELSSSLGYVATDQDLIWQKFKTEYGRDFQYLITIEIKTHGATLSPSQRDTLGINNQLVRNRRQTPTKKLLHQAGTSISRVYSAFNGKEITIRHMGVHVLRFSGTGPDDSEWIEWDHKKIDPEILFGILRFELDPDSLNKMDGRSHHLKNNGHMNSLFGDLG